MVGRIFWKCSVTRRTTLNLASSSQSTRISGVETILGKPSSWCESGCPDAATISINRLTVGSFITNVADGASLKAGGTTLKGIAFDSGNGIKDVAVSTDGGKTWESARLGKELSKYSFREWSLPVKLPAGAYELKVRATSNDGKTQPMEALWNPAGYLRNVVETVRVTAA